MLKYKNHLLQSVLNDIVNHYVFTDPSRTTKINKLVKFDYLINIDETELVKQADLFSTRLYSHKGYRDRYSITKDRNSVMNNLKKSFIYSYYKCVFHAYSYINANPLPISNLSNVFYGHYILFETICTEVIVDVHSATNLQMYRSLSVTDELIELLKESDYFKSFIDSKGKFFNPDIERILNDLSEGDYGLHMVNMRTHNPTETSSSIPLGNTCLSKNHLELNRCICSNILDNLESYFWNKACFVTLEYSDTLDSNDSFYRTVSNGSYDETNLALEVYSITGFNPMWFNLNYIGDSNGSGTPSNTGPTQPSPSGGSDKGGTPGYFRKDKGSNKNKTIKGQKAGPMNDVSDSNLEVTLSNFDKSYHEFAKKVETIAKVEKGNFLAELAVSNLSRICKQLVRSTSEVGIDRCINFVTRLRQISSKKSITNKDIRYLEDVSGREILTTGKGDRFIINLGPFSREVSTWEELSKEIVESELVSK